LLPTDEGFTSLGYPPPRTIALEPFPVPSILSTDAEVALPLTPGTLDVGPKVAHESLLAPDILDADPQEVDLNHGPQCNNSCAVCCKESVCEDTVTKIADDIRHQTPKGKSSINSKLENSNLSMALHLIGPPFDTPF
jgi:hypothetical protein